jgi:YggT family protein
LQLARELLWFVLWLFLLVLIARIVVSWTQVLARDFRPHGVVLVIFEFVYSVTDPFLKPLQRVIPPVRIGNIGFDVAFLVLFIAVSVLMSVVRPV